MEAKGETDKGNCVLLPNCFGWSRHCGTCRDDGDWDRSQFITWLSVSCSSSTWPNLARSGWVRRSLI